MYEKNITYAEAHLYVGVAKADGAISQLEYSHIPIHAEKSQKLFETLNHIDHTSSIRTDIRSIMSDPAFRSWSPESHLDEAINTLKELHAEGVWQSRIVFTKNENGFVESAKIDGYVIKEAVFIKLMESKLAGLFIDAV